MGTFERIRKISPYALALFVIIFVGFMVASDADISTILQQGSNPQTAAIAYINGEKILYKDFQDRVNQAIEQQRSQMNDPEAEIDQNQIMTQVWDQMVTEIIIKQEAEKLGIKVTNDEIIDNLIENPPDFLARSFTDTAGQFNRKIYLDLITNPENIVKYMGRDPNQIPIEEREKAINDFRNDLIKIENYLRSQKLNEALNTTITTAGSMISPIYAKNVYKDENSFADVRFIHLSYRDINPDQIKVTDQEIKDYFEKNKIYYKGEEQRKIKYTVIPIQPSKDDSIRAEKRIQKIMEDLNSATDIAARDSIFEIKLSEFSGTSDDWKLLKDIDPMKTTYLANASERQVIGPVKLFDGVYFFRLDGRRTGENEVAQASHILVSFGNNKDSARAEAEKILKRVRSGEDFSKLAQELSQDKGSAAQGGDLGYFGKGRMVKPFEDAVFSANVGQIVGPVETQFGYHIIKVMDKKSDELKYSEIKITPTISNPTRNKLFMDAHSFVKQVEGGKSFDTLAKQLNLRVDTTDFISKTFPLFGYWSLTNEVFDLPVGGITKPKEMKKSGIVIIQVIDEVKEGAPSLAVYEKEIRRNLIRKKQIDMLKEKAEKIYNEVKNIGDLANVTNYDVKHFEKLANNGQVPAVGMDLYFTNSIFNSPTGKILEPIRGENGWYIAQIYSKQVPDDNEIKEKYVEKMRQLRQSAKSAAYGNWFQTVKQKAKIEDYRSKFYSEY